MEAKESRPDAGPGAGDASSVSTVHDDILLAKMVAGQEIELEAHCVKGLGKDHAKFSPVGTAWYRMVPKVEFLAPIVGEDADVFLRQCDAPIAGHKCYAVSGSGAKRTVEVREERGCDLCVERVRELSASLDGGQDRSAEEKGPLHIHSGEHGGSCHRTCS